MAFNRAFFFDAPNCLSTFLSPEFLERNRYLEHSLRVIDVAAAAPGMHLELIMDDNKGKAVCFLEADAPEPEEEVEA